MNTNSIIVIAGLVLAFFILFLLSKLLRSLIQKQIDDQLKDMIPIKAIRKRVAIKIKWRN